MPMENVLLSVPKNFVPFLTVKTPEQEFARNAMMVFPFIKNETISYGRAAEILGVKKYALIQFYTNMGIEYINYDFSEVEKEFETFKALEKVSYFCNFK